MEPHAGQIVINSATSQYDRWLYALDADYAKVDGRSFEELLDFAVRYGALINFYNLRDRPDGDWVLFFLTDPTMLLASVGATDLLSIESAFAQLERKTTEARDFERKFRLLRETFGAVLAPARLINFYLQALGPEPRGETARLLKQRIEAAIEEDLGGQLRKLKSYDEGAGLPDALGRPVGLDYSGFLPVWGLGLVACPDGSIYRGRTEDKKIDHALPHLNPIFNSFLYALSDLRQFALAHLPATLDEGNHKPHIALYMAFAQLFSTAQDTINTISSRYSGFYYRDILRESERGPIPDSVYLTFTLEQEEEVLSTTVFAGTLFPAGQDVDGRDILYASDKDLVVTAASIGKLRALRVVSGKLFDVEPTSPAQYGDETAEPPGVVRRVLSTEIIAGADKAAEGTAGTQASWATFGEAHAEATELEVTEPALLGFAVASDYLLLTGGARTVMLDISYPEAFKESVLDPLLAQLSAATGLGKDEIFRLVLDEAFRLYVSTSSGWFEVESYDAATTPAQGAVEPSFGLRFELPPGVPAVVPYDPEGAEGEDEAAAPVTDDASVDASNPAPSLPTLKVYMRQEPVRLSGHAGTVCVYPLSLLAEMEVTSIRIDADVSDLSDLQLENTDGEIDASTPFLTFGGLPVVGSFLLIRQRELFVKTLESLTLVLTWFNLPQNEDGFKGYYKYYVIGLDGRREPNLFNNQVFRGGLSVQNPGPWFFGELTSPPLQEDVYLFRTRDDCASPIPTEAGALCADTVFAPPVSPATPPPYYDPEQSAVRLELTEPPYAFGNSLYAQNVLNAVIEDLPDTGRCQEECAAECRVLEDAALCVAECIVCLGECPQTSAGADPSCVTACVENCLKCLLDLAVACVDRCLREAGVWPVGGTLPRGEAGVRTLMQLSGEERAALISRYLDERAAWLSSSSPPHGPCLDKCFKIFEAILCAADCADGAASPPVASLEQCLSSCMERLNVAHEECVEVCMNGCMSLKKELKYPNEPYLPQATKLSVNYRAGCTIPTTNADETCGQFFHLLPFGGYKRLDASATAPPRLLPNFSYPGNLYIGFTGLIPPQTLTMLFQMAGESGGAASEPPPVAWDYLSGNRWTRLQKSQVLLDSTNGLQNTGVVALGLPTYNPSNNTVLSSNFQWLRASVESEPGRFPRTVGIYPHALLATWQDYDNTGEHLAKPLPPYTITGSVQDLPDIAAIVQPVESFGGSPPEINRTFEVRVGERLRHKDRAVLGWDYERLVLERFPTVWKVQALPARSPQKGDAPGEVTVVVVSGPDSLQAIDPTTPTVATETLGHILTYLEHRTSPFVNLHVVNPVYVRIEVSAAVRFRSGESQGAAATRLNEELVQYLSPWFYDATRAAKGGRYVSESEISEFIQTRPYVDWMDRIELRYEPSRDSLEWYFLTSAKQHRILDADAVVAPDRPGY